MAEAEAQAIAQQLASLHRTARTALDTGRSARALELYDRALASAEATLPPDSLVIAALVFMSVVARITARVHATIGSAAGDVHPQELARMSAPQLEATVAPIHAAWREEERALAASQRCMALLLGRWRAGTLLAPAPHELAFYEVDAAVVQSRALELFVNCAADAVMWWPPRRSASRARRRRACAACTARSWPCCSACRSSAWGRSRSSRPAPKGSSFSTPRACSRLTTCYSA
jgi:hypothetical protein